MNRRKVRLLRKLRRRIKELLEELKHYEFKPENYIHVDTTPCKLLRAIRNYFRVKLTERDWRLFNLAIDLVELRDTAKMYSDTKWERHRLDYEQWKTFVRDYAYALTRGDKNE